MIKVLTMAAALAASGCAALVVGGAGSQGTYPSTTTSSTVSEADVRISNAVKAELRADRILSGVAISVSSRDGVVTLDGSVANYTARSQAETLTAGVAGVRGINNRLKIAGGI